MSFGKPILICSAIGSAIGGCVLLKEYLAGGKYEETIDASNKVVIITGANTGIGKAAALQFAQKNAKVIMACRDKQKCEEARESIVLETRNKYVYCRTCDLASQGSIRTFVDIFKKEHKRLDVLVNNAGVMTMDLPKSLTEDGIEMHLGVNYIGHFLLTHLLIDRLQDSAPSRIINLIDIAYQKAELNVEDLNSDVCYDGEKAYNQSKLANMLFTTELAKRLEGSGVTVNGVDPGVVETDLLRHTAFYKSAFASILVKPFTWPFIKSPRQAAQAVVYASLNEELQNMSGKCLKYLQEEEIAPVGKDHKSAAWLWLVSLKWTKLDESTISQVAANA